MAVNFASKKGLWVSLALSLASLGAILALTVDEQTLESVLRLKPSCLALAALMVFLLWFLEGLRIRSLALALGFRGALPLHRTVRVYLVTYFFGGITPLALGEFPAQVYSLCQSGLSAGESAAVSLVRTFLTKCLFVVLAAFLLYTDSRTAGSGLVFRLFRYAFLVMTATTAAYLLVLWQAGLARKILARLLKIRPFRSLYGSRPKLQRSFSRVLDEASHFQETVRRVNRGNILHLLAPVFYTVFFWGVFFSIALVILHGLGIKADWRAVVTWQVMIQLVLPYVPVPGGSGVAELGLATLFSAFVPSHVLGVFIVAWRFFTYYLPLIAGGAIVLGIRR